MIKLLMAAAVSAFLSASSVSAEPTRPPPPLPVPASHNAVPIPSPAASERPATPETLALAARLAPIYLEGMDESVGPAVISELAGHHLEGLGDREAEYRRIIDEACRDAFQAAKPEIERILTRALATRFTAASLRAGAKFAETPSGRKALEAVAQAANGAPRPKSSGVGAALIRLESTPDGRAFLHGLGTELKSYDNEVAAAVIPPLLLRLSEKLRAYETQRTAALATAPGEPKADNLALGVSVAHDIYGLADDKIWDKLKGLAIDGMKRSMGASTTFRPEWPAIVGTTLIDTLRNDQPAVEQTLGRALARLYTSDELQAISEVSRSPAPAYLVTAGLAKQRGEVPPPPSPEVKAALEKFRASGWSQSVFLKLQDKEQARRVGVDVILALLPGWTRRLGEQLGADEAAVEARRGW